MNKPVYIHSVGATYFDASVDACNNDNSMQSACAKQPDLKDELKLVCPQHFRRIDRFTQLALIGVGRCLIDTNIEPSTALYLATGKGPGENNIAMQQSLVKDKQVPKPIQFINAVSNSVCYYIMKAFNLHGQGLLISRQTHAFEAALTLANADIQLSNSTFALIGIVDEITHPLGHQTKRMGLTRNTPLGEGSHWFLLGAQQNKALASIVSNEQCDAISTLGVWINDQLAQANTANNNATVALYFDTRINTQTIAEIESALNCCSKRVHSDENLWHGVNAGVIAAFLKDEQCASNTLISISRNAHQRFLAIVVVKPQELGVKRTGY